MLHRRPICVFFVACVLIVSGFPSGESKSFESVPDLEKAMYLNIDGYPCVRLLNTSGEIGCSNPGRSKISAPIIRWKGQDRPVSQPSTFLVAEDDMQSFFLRVSGVKIFAAKVAGVLIESNDVHFSSALSPDRKFPQSEFAPYKDQSHEWNPLGSGIMWNRYDFPVFLLSKNSTLSLQETLSKNDERYNGGTVDFAEFDMVMQTTKVGTHNSESCLKENSCLPLGGYSVWSSLPPVNATSGKPLKPIILVMASLDSSSFFRDKSVGADFPLSGMISLLAAVDALSNVHDLSQVKKQVVFVFFTGEAWGYLGSRRFLVELDLGTDATKGLNTSLIDQILEIGSVGKATRQGVTTLFAHAAGDSSRSNEILMALQQASKSLGSEKVKVNASSASNPGLPPSSLMSFLNKNASTAGVVLEDFDSAFTNKFYHSHLDSTFNIDLSSVEAAANLVARATYLLANGAAESANTIRVNSSLIEELAACLLSCDPGLACPLVRRFISSAAICPSHYVGVFINDPSGSPPTANVDDTSRFVWNFLAAKTGAAGSTCREGKCLGDGQVCVGLEADGIGRCHTSSTRYVPAYSPRLQYVGGSWRLGGVHESDPAGGVDPVWTESFWNSISVRIYRAQSPGFNRLVLNSGMLLTFLSYGAIVCARAFLMKALKRD
ncbi:Zn-dependent exopeptidases superfamily protein [Wolffia australiana]